MNESEHHPKLRVQATLGAPVFVAGTDVFGKIEVESRVESELGLRAIYVELHAVEQLISKNHAATSSFIETRRLFQGPSLPPSSASHSRTDDDDSGLPPDYLPARKGRTSFNFKLPLPYSAPSSLKFGGIVSSITYQVKAGVEVIWKGERRQVVNVHEIDVVECPEGGEMGNDVGAVVVGEGGKIWSHGRILEPFAVAGRPVTCRLHVKNNSLKKISGVHIKLIRKLHLEKQPSSGHDINISDTLLTIPFRGPEYTVQAFSEGVAHLVVNIPRSARGVRRGPREVMDARGQLSSKNGIFHVQCYLQVTLVAAFSEHDVEMLIPIRVYHKAAVPSFVQHAPPAHITSDLSPNQWNAPEALGYLDTGYVTEPGPTEGAVIPAAEYYDDRSYPYPQQMSYAEGPMYEPSLSPPHSPQHTFYHDTSFEYQPQSPVWPGISPPTGLIMPPPTLPPRPSSAGPLGDHHVSIMEMPYNLPYPEASSVLPSVAIHDYQNVSAQPQQIQEDAPIVTEIDVDRASRISRHLRMTSRNRSVSPPRARRSIMALHSPNRAPPNLTPVGGDAATVRYSPVTPTKLTTSTSQNDDSPTTPHRSQSIISPRPSLSPRVSYDANAGDRSPVEELERLVLGEAAPAQETAASDSAQGEYDESQAQILINKTLPRPPTVSSSTAARGLPAAAFGWSTVDTSSEVQTNTVTSSPLTHTNTQQPRASLVPSGLTLLEKRLGRPAVYDIFTQEQGSSTSQARTDEPNSTKPGTNTFVKGVERETQPVAKPNQETSTKTSPPRKLQTTSDGRRIQSAQRVNSWLQKGDDPRASGNKSIPRSNSDPPLNERRALIPQNESASQEPSEVVASPGLKSSPDVALSPGLSKMDWRTLQRTNDRDETTSVSHRLPRISDEPPPRFSASTKPSTPADPIASKYDVRSARGGRGGLVASAAAFWSAVSSASSPNTSSPSAPNPRIPQKPQKFSRPNTSDEPPKANSGFRKSILPLDTLIQATTPPRTRVQVSPTPMRMRPDLIKTRIVDPKPLSINHTVGRPILTSSATLIRSSNLATPRSPPKAPRVEGRAQIPPPPPRPVTSRDPSLGRDRFLELVSRYQNQ